MTSKKENKSPEYEEKWPSMDIFVFSNGQQYLPPRKYHLRSEDFNFWKPTLSHLARMQYGSLHSNIQLYTIDGRKVLYPMELRDGAYYVAIKPPDSFIDAGYEKYLMRASRSWEKQQAKRAGSAAPPDKSPKNTEIINPDVRTEEPNDQLQEEKNMLKTILSSMMNHETSTIQKPELADQQKVDTQRTNKTIDRKKTPIPRLAVRKNNSTTPPAQHIKPSIKKKDVIKTSTIKIPNPEVDQNSGYSHAKKVPIKNKVHETTTRPKDITEVPETVLKEDQRIASEINLSSATKIHINNNNKLSTNVDNLKNVAEDKDLILVSICLQHPKKEMVPLVTVHPIQIQHESKIHQGETANLNQIIQIENQEVQNPQNINGETNLTTTMNSVEIIKIIESSPVWSSTEVHINEDNDVNNEVNYKVNERNKAHDSIIVMRALTDNHPDSNNSNRKVEKNQPDDNQPGFSNRNSKVERNMNMNSDGKIVAPEVKNDDLTTKLNLNATDRSLDDRYVAVLKKGDIVNLNFNIEIQSYPCGSGKHDNYMADLK